nr:KAT8 regulatory NSL complex subunit 3 [Ipomoea batatas]
MVASGQDIGASAVVCLGYPLKGINGAVRDEILLKLRVPIMFVQVHTRIVCLFYLKTNDWCLVSFFFFIRSIKFDHFVVCTFFHCHQKYLIMQSIV